jgi:ubiquinone/menaquinone biosynthesis C-methylase UbiE
MPADFEKQSYWHERFASETSFEWLTTSAAFMEVLIPHLQRVSPTARILHLGSGTSDLHNHLRHHGYLNVTNIDYEPLALERGRQLEQNRFGDVQTKYLVADATQLESAEKYQIVIDKSTADAIACGEGDIIFRMAQAVRRCLEHDGLWISLSYSPRRFEHVQSLFEVEVVGKVPTPKSKPTDPNIYHYCYRLRPREQV